MQGEEARDASGESRSPFVAGIARMLWGRRQGNVSNSTVRPFARLRKVGDGLVAIPAALFSPPKPAGWKWEEGAAWRQAPILLR
jgi:hypothetical protein